MTLHPAINALELRLGRPLWATGEYVSACDDLPTDYNLGIDPDDVAAVSAHFEVGYAARTLYLRGFEVRLEGGDVQWFAADDARFDAAHMARIERIETEHAEETGAFAPYEYMQGEE